MQYKLNDLLEPIDDFLEELLTHTTLCAVAAATCEIRWRPLAAAVWGQLGAFSIHAPLDSGSKFQSESQLDLMSFEVHQIEYSWRRDCLAPDLNIPRRRHESVSGEPGIEGRADIERLAGENI